MAALDAVVFDLFHTLVDTEHVRPVGYDPVSLIVALLGADLERFAGFWGVTYLERETTDIDVVDLVDRFARSAGESLTPSQRSEVDQILGRYRDLAVLNPQPKAVELIKGLSKRVRLGLLTNC